jgi:serine/threonine protein kinase
MSYTSAAARAAFRKKSDGRPYVRYAMRNRQDQGPFDLGKRLGRGGWGEVYYTQLDGVEVALKIGAPFDVRKRSTHENEIQVLQRLASTENRHRHVVELVGYFELEGILRCRLGLFLWRVAQCDLGKMFDNMDILSLMITRLARADEPTDIATEEKNALQALSNLTATRLDRAMPNALPCGAQEVHEKAKCRLYTTLGCLAQTMSYLHIEKVRHKDLNPSQILLSPNGLWVTDFGMSVDFSQLGESATQNGDNTTPRYQAPERMMGCSIMRCGRAEDVFGLGCTYLEIWYCIRGFSVQQHLSGKGKEKWSYQANLRQIDEWLAQLTTRMKEETRKKPGLNTRDSSRT